MNYAGAGVGGTTGGGTNYGRGVGGVSGTTAGGHQYGHVGRAGAAQGPGGVSVGSRGGVGAVSGPGGTATGMHRSAAASGPGGTAVRGGAIGAGPGGTAVRGGAAAVGPYGAAARGGAAVSGPGGTAARHATAYAGPNYAAARGTAVRNGYAYHRAYFNPGWYAAHPGAWTAARWTAAGIWAATSWAAASSYGGYAYETPITYDYGNTIVCQDDGVYVNGEQLATPEVYAEQAITIAETGRKEMPAADGEWQPLGVFGMVQGEETVANTLFQLAVNKEGVIRGNYYDALGDNNLPVFGSVDKKTQRAAWSVGEKKDIVYEAGIYNLTQPECTVLIHYGKEKTRQMLLIRLEQPAEGGKQPNVDGTGRP